MTGDTTGDTTSEMTGDTTGDTTSEMTGDTTSDTTGETPAGPPSERARVRRKPDRARYDAAAVYAVLDAAPFCHVATVRAGHPVVLPMVHARVDDALMLHGSVAAGLFRDMRRASPVCVTATLLDGLVLARSARNHSANYRSVTVHGEASEVTDPDEKMIGMWALVEHLAPGRWDQLRKPEPGELGDTALWRVRIAEASVKARSGPPADPPEDVSWPVWAGQIPASQSFGLPVPAAGLPESVDSSGRDVLLNPAFGGVSPAAGGAGRPG